MTAEPDVLSPARPARAASDGLRWVISFVCVVLAYSLQGWLHLLPWAVAVAVWLSRPRDVSHPGFWFLPIFSLYGVAFYVIVEAGLIQAYPQHASPGLLYRDPNHHFASFMHLIALLAFVAGASGPSVERRGFDTAAGVRQPILIWAALAFLMSLSYYHYSEVLSFGGLSSKQDIRLAREDSLGLRLTPIYVPLALVMGLVISRAMLVAPTIMPILVAAFVGWGFLGLFITGERDIALRILIVVGFLWNFQVRRVPMSLAIAGFGVLILALPVLQAAKGLMLGGFGDVRLGLYGLLGGEFKASGRVFTVLLSWWPGFMYGETLVWDVLRALSFGPLQVDVVSTSQWFNREFLGQDAAGWGFSLVGEFYLNFGAIGVIAGFYLFGKISLWLYYRQARSPAALVGYAVYASIAIYAVRGDAALLLGSPIKLVLIPIAILIFGEKVLGLLSRRSPT